MEEIILNIIEKFGYLGVFLLIAIENIFPPIPSEVILLFSGFITINTKLNIFYMILFSLLGSLLGAIILYFIGRLINKDRIKQLLSTRIGKTLKLTNDDIDKADDWFNKKGNKAVFICRFIPVVRSLISIPAGMNKMNMVKFIVYTILGSLIWNIVLLFLGYKVGENWTDIAAIIDKYSLLVLIILILTLVIFIIMLFYRKNKKAN